MAVDSDLLPATKMSSVFCMGKGKVTEGQAV